MSSKIKIDGLENAILKELSNYKDATEEAMSKAVNETASVAVQKLHSAKPSGSEKYGSWNEYNKGWTGTKQNKGRNKCGIVIHNKTHYRLTHLLENGHALRNGGRARAFPHIAPVNEECEELLMKAITEGLESI